MERFSPILEPPGMAIAKHVSKKRTSPATGNALAWPDDFSESYCCLYELGVRVGQALHQSWPEDQPDATTRRKSRPLLHRQTFVHFFERLSIAFAQSRSLLGETAESIAATLARVRTHLDETKLDGSTVHDNYATIQRLLTDTLHDRARTWFQVGVLVTEEFYEGLPEDHEQPTLTLESVDHSRRTTIAWYIRTKLPRRLDELGITLWHLVPRDVENNDDLHLPTDAFLHLDPLYRLVWDHVEVGLRLMKEFAACRPEWDATKRELSFGQEIVASYDRDAKNQFTILRRFQEQGWPNRVGEFHMQPEALGQTVRDLEKKLRRTPIRFHLYGAGSGVRWSRRQVQARRRG
jgi:hypothetical protein